MRDERILFVSWTTAGRAPCINIGLKSFLERFLPAAARHHNVRILSMQVVAEQVSIILGMPHFMPAVRLVRSFKDLSAQLANRDARLAGLGLRWEPGFRALTVDPATLDGLLGRAEGGATVAKRKLMS